MADRQVSVLNKTKHPMSPSELREFSAGRTPAGATRMELVETKHEDVTQHEIKLIYTTANGRFLFCEAAGGSFSDVLKRLKTCKNQATKLGSATKAPAKDPIKSLF